MSASHDDASPTLLARFASADDLRSAAQALRDNADISLEAYCPFPIEGLAETLGHGSSPMPKIIAIGGVLGGVSMYGLEYWINVYAYPLNIGGRPLHSWPSFVPPTFELTVLIASIFALLGVLYLCGLPQLHHRLFEIDEFRRASCDGFFLTLELSGADRELRPWRDRLNELGAISVWEVPDV
ncbi:DUF3341 domain-containing protein [Roseiconus nitratireducens]|uniref:DUF3341 domain-containing protein n=1 Tax=Roseiconus nitratireducens TaxID=2605748 RepID=A0A5M6D394_9BACT|nr:DUF3341 domain-containing protein [Roseiconus nitratireducens]KAA5541803.1 DUF3341 domain-containing protein [Roseiconus nitratireducens]